MEYKELSECVCVPTNYRLSTLLYSTYSITYSNHIHIELPRHIKDDCFVMTHTQVHTPGGVNRHITSSIARYSPKGISNLNEFCRVKHTRELSILQVSSKRPHP